MNLNLLTDEELLRSADKAVQCERDATTAVIRHLQEIYDRKLFLPKYTSMFDMLCGEYRYCAGSAQIRLNAMKLIRDVPAVEARIESGELSLSAAASVQSFLQYEKKNARAYSNDAKIELVETCVGKSTRDVEREFAKRNPKIEKREAVRFTSDDRLRVSHSISLELEEKLKRIKEIWSHVDPNMSREQLLNRMAEVVLEKIDPIRKASRAEVRRPRVRADVDADADAETVRNRKFSFGGNSNLGDSEAVAEAESANSFHAHEVKLRTRFIKAKAQHEVHRRNGNTGCEYVDEQTNQRCGSRYQLQIDHIKPFALGGPNDSANLRLMCAQHNRWRTFAPFVAGPMRVTDNSLARL